MSLERMEVYRYSIPPQPCMTVLGPGIAVEIEFSPFWWDNRDDPWFRYGVALDETLLDNLAYFIDSKVTLTKEDSSGSAEA